MSLPTLQQFQAPMFRPADAKLRAMEFQDKSRRTDIAEDRNAIARERQALNREEFEFNKAKSTFVSSRDFIGGMDRNEVSEYKDWLSKIPVFGELAGLLPDQQELFEMSEEEFVGMKEKIRVGTDNVAAMEGKQLEETLKIIREKRENAEWDRREKIKQENKKPTALEGKIKEIKAAYPGMSDEKTRKIATGTLKVITDPFSGTTTLVDVGTGETIPMKERGQQSSAEEPIGEPEQTLWDMSELATGPVSAALSAASVPSGVVGGPIAEKTIEARQYMSSSQNDLIRSLSINPRFPVGEIKRLQKEINISPSVFDNPKMMKARMRAVDSYLRRRLRKENRVSSDASKPMAERKAASSAAVDIEEYIKILGVPQKNESQILSEEDQALIDKYKD